MGPEPDDSAAPTPRTQPLLHELSLRRLFTGVADIIEQSTGKQSAGNQGLLVTLDEFHAAELHEARELAAAIQHVTRREQRPVALVLAALPEVTETVLADPGMTFFHRCARAEIGLLGYGATQTALQVPIREAGGAIDDEALKLGTRASGGYPFMVQLVGFHGWESCADGLKHLGINDMHEGIFEADQALTDTLLMPLWSALSPTDRDILRRSPTSTHDTLAASGRNGASGGPRWDAERDSPLPAGAEGPGLGGLGPVWCAVVRYYNYNYDKYNCNKHNFMQDGNSG